MFSALADQNAVLCFYHLPGQSIFCHLSEAAISTCAVSNMPYAHTNEDSKVLNSSMMHWTRVNVISLSTIVPVIWRFRTNSPFCKHFHKIAFKNVFRFLGNVNGFQGRMSWVIVTTSLIHLCSLHVYMKEMRNLGHQLHCKDSVRNLVVVILRHAWDLHKTFICLRFSLHWE